MSANLSNESMSIDDIKTAKRQCESEVRAIIAVFEKQSGCHVYSVDLIREHLFGDEMAHVVDVALDVRL